ncbi:hypothetical protein SDC9_203739 [bioreactor metagenome]|jgi:hypothetical protein|uniref:Uncharacterized protein n=1 Tax=bioreactor metagenome TaxID=1076179 RepID=A0A645J968_9ZZZZ
MGVGQMAIFDYNGNMAYNILYDSSEVCSHDVCAEFGKFI